MSRTICEHPDFDTYGYCVQCKSPIDLIYTGPERGKRTKMINKCLDRTLFSDIMKMRATLIYNRLNIGNLKMPNKAKAVSYCVYMAAHELGLDITSNVIASSLNQSLRQMASNIALYRSLDPGWKCANRISEPRLLRKYCEKANMNDNYIDDLIEKYSEDRPSLNKSITRDPNKVVLSYIVLYSEYLGSDNIDEDIFYQTYGISYTSLSSTIHNLRPQIHSFCVVY